jgi:hypothetical protein
MKDQSITFLGLTVTSRGPAYDRGHPSFLSPSCPIKPDFSLYAVLSSRRDSGKAASLKELDPYILAMVVE